MKPKEFIGKALYRTIGNWPYFPGTQIRRICGSLMFAHCGKNVNIRPKAQLSPDISLGDRSGIGDGAYLGGKIFIGNDVMMGRDVKIITANHQTKDTETPMILQGFAACRPVCIEDDVWIGSNVMILPGVHIGRGSILGAGSVIRENVPPYAVVIGNPSFILKYRKGMSPDKEHFADKCPPPADGGSL